MKILVIGGAGHLGTRLVETIALRGDMVLSVSSKPAPSQWAGLETLEHTECDTEDSKEFALLVERFVERHGSFDGIVSLASRGSRGISLKTPSQDFATDLAQGCLPTWTILSLCSDLLMPSASVVVVASLWAQRIPEPRMYLDLQNEPSLSLPASKAAQRQIVRYFAAILAPRGIRVNMVTPGWFPKPSGTPRPDYIREIEQRTPMARIGRPDEVIEPILFLLGSGSSFITGQELIVDGGFSLW